MSLEPVLPARSGLAIACDVVVAPRTAFEALRERTHWGWAFVLICALGLVGGFLQVPAGEHVALSVMQQGFAHDPNLAGLSPDKQRQMLQFATVSQRFAWLLYPVVALIAILIASAVFTVANAILKGRGTFARLFGFSANVAVINFGIGYLLIGLLCALRGPAAFSTTRDIYTLMPSPAWLVPAAAPKVATLLAAFNPLEIWSFVLIGLGLPIVAGTPRGAAYIIAAIVTFGSAILPAIVAQ